MEGEFIENDQVNPKELKPEYKYEFQPHVSYPPIDGDDDEESEYIRFIHASKFDPIILPNVYRGQAPYAFNQWTRIDKDVESYAELFHARIEAKLKEEQHDQEYFPFNFHANKLDHVVLQKDDDKEDKKKIEIAKKDIDEKCVARKEEQETIVDDELEKRRIIFGMDGIKSTSSRGKN